MTEDKISSIIPEEMQDKTSNDFSDIDLKSNSGQELVNSPWLIEKTGEIVSITKIRSAEQNSVFKLSAENGIYILKSGPGLENEKVNLAWLNGKLPVPKVIAWYKDEENDKLLTSFVEGEDLARLVNKISKEEVIQLLADALHDLHSVNTSDYPGEDENSSYVFIHGDACLPNFMIKDGKLNGFIDLGSACLGDTETDLAAAVWSLDFNYGPGLGASFLRAYGIVDTTEEYAEILRKRYEDSLE